MSELLKYINKLITIEDLINKKNIIECSNKENLLELLKKARIYYGKELVQPDSIWDMKSTEIKYKDGICILFDEKEKGTDFCNRIFFERHEKYKEYKIYNYKDIIIQ
jgi:hypothetical protein